MQPLVSIITVNYNALEVTCELLNSIRNNSYANVETIVVDNASEVNPEGFLKEHYPEIKFIRSEQNRGFAGGNNLGIRASTGDFLFFLNNDAELTESAIETLLALFGSVPRLGAASPKICYHNNGAEGHDVIQYAGTTPVHPLTARNRTIGVGQFDTGQFAEAKPTAYAHGAAMMLRREVIEKVGGMPEAFFLYYEELDWCEQIRRAGYQIYVEPRACIYHKESYTVSRNSVLKTYYLTRNRLFFMRRNKKQWQWAAFCAFLLVVTLPKNLLVYGAKGEWQHAKAFLNAIRWNFSGNKNISPVSTPLTFITSPVF
ncbi:MAG: glycosyltransferase family 2 protein [Saprospiraceae bacterium]|nr:MAG: glycosyltransferase family 2 protein [Saprospiraceae bacterium]